MFPSEWRDVLEESGIDGLRLSKCLDSTFEVDGVPERDGCCDQVQSTGPMTVVFKGAVPYLAQAVEEDGAGEGIAGFSFIKDGGDATAQGGIFEPGERVEAFVPCGPSSRSASARLF